MIARCASFILLTAICASGALRAQAPDDANLRATRHQSADWLTMEPHLPDPQTATSDELQLAADVLRARRFPEDALEYYRFALARAGPPALLFNRIGVTELELHRPEAAQVAFKRVLALEKRNAQTWNNLGAAHYMLGDVRSALSDYRKAVKLDRKIAVFHSNLGTALFENKDFPGARVQFATAMKLDPLIFQRAGGTGVQAHVLSTSDRGRFCFEMAQLSATNHNDEGVLLWFARATEAGFDLKGELDQTRELAAYRHDPRVVLLIANAKALHPHQLAASPVPALLGDTPTRN